MLRGKERKNKARKYIEKQIALKGSDLEEIAKYEPTARNAAVALSHLNPDDDLKIKPKDITDAYRRAGYTPGGWITYHKNIQAIYDTEHTLTKDPKLARPMESRRRTNLPGYQEGRARNSLNTGRKGRMPRAN